MPQPTYALTSQPNQRAYDLGDVGWTRILLRVDSQNAPDIPASGTPPKRYWNAFNRPTIWLLFAVFIPSEAPWTTTGFASNTWGNLFEFIPVNIASGDGPSGGAGYGFATTPGFRMDFSGPPVAGRAPLTFLLMDATDGTATVEYAIPGGLIIGSWNRIGVAINWGIATSVTHPFANLSNQTWAAAGKAPGRVRVWTEDQFGSIPNNPAIDLSNRSTLRYGTPGGGDTNYYVQRWLQENGTGFFAPSQSGHSSVTDPTTNVTMHMSIRLRQIGESIGAALAEPTPTLVEALASAWDQVGANQGDDAYQSIADPFPNGLLGGQGLIGPPNPAANHLRVGHPSFGKIVTTPAAIGKKRVTGPYGPIPSGQVIDKLYAFMGNAALNPGLVRALIYQDASGTPGTLLGASQEVSIPVGPNATGTQGSSALDSVDTIFPDTEYLNGPYGPVPVASQISVARVYMGNAAGQAVNARVTVYSDNNGEPGQLLGASLSSQIGVADPMSWVTFNFLTPVSISGMYWLGIQTGGGTVSVNSTASSGVGRRMIQTYNNGPVNPYAPIVVTPVSPPPPPPGPPPPGPPPPPPPPSPPPPPPPPPPSTGLGPSGIAIPTVAVSSGGYSWKAPIFMDEFNGQPGSTGTVPLGSWISGGDGSPNDPNNLAKWTAFPNTWDKSYTGNATIQRYYPEKVLSINVPGQSDHCMDYYLHQEVLPNVGLRALVGCPLPRIPRGQTNFRIQVCAKFIPIQGYHPSWLLWPDSNVWPRDGEIDFPEADLGSPASPGTITGFMHNMNATAGNDQIQVSAAMPSTNSGWHVFCTEWVAGQVCNYYLDGVLKLHATSRVPSTPMHYALQLNYSATTYSGASGHILVDWVSIQTL